jgi:hypothetical protein
MNPDDWGWVRFHRRGDILSGSRMNRIPSVGSRMKGGELLKEWCVYI